MQGSSMPTISTDRHPVSTQQPAKAVEREGKTTWALQRKAVTSEATHLSPPSTDRQSPEPDGTASLLARRESKVVQPVHQSTDGQQWLPPEEQLSSYLNEYFLDTDIFGFFDDQFYEQLPTELKSIFLESRNDLQECIRIDECREKSDEDKMRLSTLLLPRLTAMMAQMKRLSTEVGLEKSKWFIPTLLILNELHRFLPINDKKEYPSPIYQLAFEICNDSSVSLEKRQSVLLYLQVHNNDLCGNADSSLMLQLLIDRLQHTGQPVPAVKPEIVLDAAHPPQLTDQPMTQSKKATTEELNNSRPPPPSSEHTKA